MEKPIKIRRNMMLKELDIRWLPNGKRNIFSVKFVDKKGQVRYFNRAYSCGLAYDMKSNRFRAIQPCDQNGASFGHVYPVNIDLFIMYNNLDVIL